MIIEFFSTWHGMIIFLDIQEKAIVSKKVCSPSSYLHGRVQPVDLCCTFKVDLSDSQLNWIMHDSSKMLERIDDVYMDSLY